MGSCIRSHSVFDRATLRVELAANGDDLGSMSTWWYPSTPSPQLRWANGLAICASLLLALFLLTLAAHHLYDTYAYWSALLDQLFFHQRSPAEPTMLVYYHEQVSANQQAIVLASNDMFFSTLTMALMLPGPPRIPRP